VTAEQVQQIAIIALMFIAAVFWKSAAHWKGRYMETSEEGGWADEALWWREQYEEDVDHRRGPQTTAGEDDLQ
jgi:hypothetical protein